MFTSAIVFLLLHFGCSCTHVVALQGFHYRYEILKNPVAPNAVFFTVAAERMALTSLFEAYSCTEPHESLQLH